MGWVNNLFSRKITLEESLKGKSSNDILELLKGKYQNPPRYINPKKIHEKIGNADEAIDTREWKFVKPEYVNGKYTGKWIPLSGGGGIFNDNWVINKLLSNTTELEEAKIPTNGGRRKRKTKVKSKKRANKRRTRSRK